MSNLEYILIYLTTTILVLMSLSIQTLDIPSSKIDIAKNLKKLFWKVNKKVIWTIPTNKIQNTKLDSQIDKQPLNIKTVLNLQGLHPESPNSNKNSIQMSMFNKIPLSGKKYNTV